MKLKTIKAYNDLEIGSIIECDETTQKELLDSKTAIEYTNEVKEQEKVELVKEIKNAVKKEINNMDTIEEKKVTGTVEVTKHAYSEFGGWKGQNKEQAAADYLVAVKRAGLGMGFDSRLESKALNGIGESSGTGTNLVTPTFINDIIQRQFMQTAVFAPKCFDYKMVEGSGPVALIKQVSETYRNSTSTFGGIRVYKVTEGNDITPSAPAFTQKSMTVSMAAALLPISEQAMRDVPNLVNQSLGQVGESFGWQVDNELINGSLSIASPVIGDASVVSYPMGTAATAADLFGMYVRLLPEYRAGAEWFMAGSTYAGIMALATPTMGYPLFNKQAKDTDKQTILGLPVNLCEWSVAGSAHGGIILANPKGYAYVTKGEFETAQSIHVYFASAQNAWRFLLRFTGAPLYASTITLPDTNAYSWAIARN